MEESTFLPKQALYKDPTLYTAITAGTTASVARDCLSLLPPITNTSMIHDNGCRSGGGDHGR